jgi:F-type H+-transporting ATPase subunit b
MDALGVTWANLLIQIVAFILFILIFWRYALGPITRVLGERQDRVRESMEAAERMRQELAATQARNEEVLAEARRDAQDILARAREVSEQNIARSREQAQQQADEMIEKARDAIASETAQARVELRREVADLAITAATKIVRTNLDREAQTRLIDETLAEAARGSNGSAPAGD